MSPSIELPGIDKQIETAERDIAVAEATIEKLTAGGHEVTDATRQLAVKLKTLESLLRYKNETKVS